jgi:hypothetical protein
VSSYDGNMSSFFLMLYGFSPIIYFLSLTIFILAVGPERSRCGQHVIDVHVVDVHGVDVHDVDVDKVRTLNGE